MKRIYIAFMALTALVSCQVTNPSSHVVDADDLLAYSNAQMGRCVTLPAELMELLVGFEEYMDKSDEDKLYDDRYYGKISEYGTGVYGISAQINGINCTVDTHGKSLWEAGAEWEFSVISYNGNYADTQMNIYHDIYLDEGAVLKMENPSDSVWTFHADNVESRLKMVKSDSLNVWNVTGTCRSDGKGDFSSVSVTGAEGMTFRKVWRNLGTTYTYQETSYGGTFSTDIFRNDEKVDFCTVKFRPGFASSYETSR